MPARFLPAPWQQHPAFEYAPASVVGTGVLDEAPVQTGTLERSEAVSNAHQAVEVVLRAVDDLSSRTQKSVRLEFSVAGDDLSVRVELHADEVRTTFRTDSPELRAALSQEWQALAGSAAGDRSVRIVPAIFNAAENSALNGFANDASSHHREPGSQPQAMFERSTVFASSDRSAVLPAAHVTPVPATRTHTSRHLHTLA